MGEIERVQGLLFDLDGLLVDSEPTWFEVEGAFLGRLGHEWTRADAEACMGQGTPNTLRIWRERFGVEVDIERDTETILDEMAARAGRMPLKEGALELLDTAWGRGLPMAVASSSRRRLIQAVVSAKGIDRYFRAIVSGQDVQRGKPAPDIFLRAASAIGVPIEACLVLEDALAGVRAGAEAGAWVVSVPSVHHPEFARLSTVVTSLRDVAGWFGAGRG